jgi:selenocysteine lyase/cysteine desulfurase
MVAENRAAAANFIGASDPNQIVWTSGATDGLNRIARIMAGKTVIVSDLDHHSARLPFEKHCKTILAPLTKNLDYDWDKIKGIKADAIVVTAMSNVLGVAQNFSRAGLITIADASQYVVYEKIDVLKTGVDFLVFSGHKIGADTGLGVLYQKTPPEPVNFGGGMYRATGAARFEAGTLPLTQIAGFGAAISELKRTDLMKKLRGGLEKIPRIKFISPPGSHIASFIVDGMHHLDFGAMMAANDVCMRVGNMCASWLHDLLGIPGSCRLSLGSWNTEAEVERVIEIINVICDK